MSSPSSKPRPSLAQTTRLVARALGITPDELLASFRTARLDDLPGMLALRSRVLGRALPWDDHAYLNWRYRLGREGQGGGDCWLLARRDGDILGMVGTQDLVLRCGSHASPALSLMDIMIQPELEGAGLGAWLNLALQAQSAVTLAIGANPQSIGMVSRLFDKLPNRRSFVQPIRMTDFLRKRLPMPILPDLLAIGLEAGMRLGRAAWLAPWSLGVQVRPLTRFDSVIDQLQAHLDPSDSLVHCVRTPQQLNWRLLDNPRAPCQVWGAWSKGQLMGYLATRLKPLDGGTRQALVVVDALVAPMPKGQPALRALLWKALGQAWRDGAEYVVMTSYREDVERELRRVGFRQQAHPFETMNWTCQDDRLKSLVATRPDWTLSEAHTDRI